MAEQVYNSVHTGEQIDAAVAWLQIHAQDQICGGAVRGTTISVPDNPTYWFAPQGTYTCGGSTITISEGNLGIISYDGSQWSSVSFYVGAAPIVNDLVTGGVASALSASMGIVIRDIIEQIFNALGEYSFPNGKPTIDWTGGFVAINLNLSDFSSSNMAQTIQRGEAYTTTLTATDLGNLYVPNVVIKMGGEDITSTTYNPTTGVVSIAKVTSAIDITATQETYVQDGLVLHLDGLNRGGSVGHWVDLINHFDFELQGTFIEDSDNIDLQGSGYASVSSVGAYLTGVSTLEVIINQKSTMQPQEYQTIAMSACQGGISIGTLPGQNGNMAFSAYSKAVSHSSVGDLSAPYLDNEYTLNAIHSITRFGGNTKVDGFSKTNASEYPANYPNSLSNGDFILGGYLGGGNITRAFNGKIYSIRLYNRVLTESEIKHNLKVDKLRFNF